MQQPDFLEQRCPIQDKAIHIHRLYRVLRSVNHAILRTRERERLFDSLCRIVVEEGGFTAAWIGLCDPNGSAPPDPVAGWVEAGKQGRLQDLPRLFPDPSTANGKGGLRSATFPLIVGDQLVAKLVMHAADDLLADEFDLLSELSADVSFALQAIELELRRQEAERALKESERFITWTLNSLAAHIAVIDEDGVILAVNEAWRAFARNNHSSAEGLCEGSNYLAVCDFAAREGFEGAAEFAAGIRAVMAGNLGTFRQEYECHSPTESRWFVGKVLRFHGDGPVRVVISHSSITDRKRAEEAVAANNRAVSTLMSNLPGMAYISLGDKHGEEEFISDGCLALTGYTAMELGPGGSIRYADIIHPDDREMVDQELLLALKEHRLYRIEYRIMAKDRSERWVWEQGKAVPSETGGPPSLKGLVLDITQRKLMESALREAQERYRILVETVDDGVIVKDYSRRYLMVNEEICRRLGKTREQIIGGSVRDFYRPEVADKIDSDDRLVLSSGKTVHTEDVFVTPSGERAYDVKKVPIRDPSGNVVGLVVVSRDSTDRKKMLEALQTSEAQVRAIFDSAPLGILLVNAQGRILRSNAGFQRLLDYCEEELEERSFTDLTAPEDTPSDLEQYQDLLDGKIDRYSIEKRFIRKDGSLKWGRVTASMVKESGGGEPLAIRILEELKQPQAVLIQWEKMASIGQLAAGVAHEINNPIGYINSNLNTLREYMQVLLKFLHAMEKVCTQVRGGLGEETAGLVQEIDRLRKQLDIDFVVEDLDKLVVESMDGSQRVKKIVQDLKSYSRSDEQESHPANLNSLLDSALNIVWNQLKYSCVVTRSYGELPEIVCNSGQLVQVFVNIFVNAGQAMQKRKDGEISVRSTVRDHLVMVEIQDNGCGMRPEVVNRVFDPFFTTKPVGEGTGLGLSISYNIIQRHGGKILVRSEVGKGTTFTIELPVEPVIPEAVVAATAGRY